MSSKAQNDAPASAELDESANKSDLQSQSSSNNQQKRRLNWNFSDQEQETYNTVVNYQNVRRYLPGRSTGAIPKQPRRTTTNWTELYHIIRASKPIDDDPRKSDDLPFKEATCEHKLSKVVTTNTPALKKSAVLVSDLQMEACYLPPHQNAVVEEAAHKYAHVIQEDCDTLTISDEDFSKLGAACVTKITPLKTSYSKESPMEKALLHLKTMCENYPAPVSVQAGGKQKTGVKRAPPPRQWKAANNVSPCQLQALTTTTTTPATTSTTTPTTMQSTFKQRQIELHNFRVRVEQRRLELLELKIARERDEAQRDKILFQKKLEWDTLLRQNSVNTDDNEVSSI